LKAPALYGMTTDDSHGYDSKTGSSHPESSWVMVRATHLTPEHIVKALKAGDSYSSTGVTLRDVQYDAVTKTLRVEVEPEADATYSVQFIGSLKGVETAGTPIDTSKLSPAEIKELGRHKHKYSDKIGEVLRTIQGSTAEYTLAGNELYVRAVVTSSLPPVDPSWEDQKQQAWTQPVGWELPQAKK